MPKYHTPGVYFEWQDRRFDTVSLARADVTGFVGIAARGQVGTPVRVETWNQFTSLFGSHTPAGYLAFAVEGFFANGGRRCWIVRVASKAATAARWILRNSQGKPAVSLVATSPGSWARDMQITTIPLGSGLFTLIFRLPDGTRETWRNLDMQRPYADIVLDSSQSIRVSLTSADLWQSPPPLVVQPQGGGKFALSVGDVSMTVGDDRNSLEGLTAQITNGAQVLSAQLADNGAPDVARLQAAMDTSVKVLQFVTPERFAGTTLNDGAAGSTLARVLDITDVPDPRSTPVFAPGTDGLKDLSEQEFDDGLAQLARIDEIAVLAMPDIYDKPSSVFKQNPRPMVSCTNPTPAPAAPLPPAPAEMPQPLGRDVILALQQSMVAQCVMLKDRMAVLDPPSPNDGPTEAQAWRNSFQTSFAACYYPWVRVPDPLGSPGALRTMPACGHIAGIFARVEKLVGVHKPPANEILQGVQDVAMEVDDIIHGLLNDEDVNVIRPTRGRQVRVLGDRTTSETDDWRYVNVRRLFIAMERSFRAQLQWTVFEPGNPALWRGIDRAVRSFMDSLWLRGFLDGASREAAYTVICDATTNPPSETDNGRVICEIGALPPWPAEFVIVRIGITEGGVEMLSPAEAQVA
jgi:phage tail sheath protein FI